MDRYQPWVLAVIAYFVVHDGLHAWMAALYSFCSIRSTWSSSLSSTAATPMELLWGEVSAAM